MTAGVGSMRCGAVLLVFLLSGCVSTVDGSALRAGALGDSEPLLHERDLEQILLTAEAMNATLNSTAIEVTQDLYTMTDDSAGVSEQACLGAVFTAEEPVYTDSGYTGVHTRLASESDELGSTVELTGVVFDSAADAEALLDASERAWGDCATSVLSLTDGEDWFRWQLGDVERGEDIVSQSSTFADTEGWQCQHSMGRHANVVIEASVCGVRVSDQASDMVNQMLVNASEQ